jgi:hypothetical protein
MEPAVVQLCICSLPDAPRFGSPDTANWASSKRKALGLTQTCRMLRTEVLPLYRKAHSVIATVWYLNSAQELDLELLDEHNVTRLMKKESDRQSAVERRADELKINIRTLLADHMLDGLDLSTYVDITSPHWRSRARAFMTRLIEAFGEKSFQEFVTREAKTATVTFGLQPPALAIELDESQSQTWMPWRGTTAATQRGCVRANAWLETFGLRKVGVEVGRFDIWTRNGPY